MGLGLEFIIPAALGVASTVGGTIMQANAAKRAGQDAVAQAAARNQQLAEYRQRMGQLSEEAQKTALAQREQFDPAQSKAREEAARKTLETQYTGDTAAPTPLANVPLGGSTPSVTEAAQDRARGEERTYTKGLASRLANLGTQPQALVGSGLSLGRAGSKIDELVNFGKQETALLPQYQDFASTYWKLKPGASSPGGAMLTGLGNSMLKFAGSKFG